MMEEKYKKKEKKEGENNEITEGKSNGTTKEGMITKAKKYWQIVINNWLIVTLIIFIIVAPPVILLAFNLWYPNYELSWLGFFGSYIGGVLGGAATLIAVVYTIQKNKEEQVKREKADKEKLIRKSALIVYYDFLFTFNNINSFMSMFWKKRLNDARGDEAQKIEGFLSRERDELGSNEIDIFKECRFQFNQFYIDSNWIYTVADLKDASMLMDNNTHLDIKLIYEIYGHLMTINKGLSQSDLSTLRNAYRAMNEIIDFKSANYNKEDSSIVFNEKKNVQDLKNSLKEIANL